MPNASPTLLWFRADLRLSDNPALRAALARKSPIIPLFIHSPESESPWPSGSASNVWLHHSLTALEHSLQKLNAQLIIRQGDPLTILQQLAQESSADAIFWNRRYEPAIIARDTAIKSALTKSGLTVETFNAALLADPREIRNKQGKPFQVFTPFHNALLAREAPPDPLPAPSRWPESTPAIRKLESLSIADLALLPRIKWDKRIHQHWEPGERGASARLSRFCEIIADYKDARDRPSLRATSELSPHLHFGEISPRQIAHRISELVAKSSRKNETGASKFLAEIHWREFAYHLLYHFPHTTDNPLREQFNNFPWLKDKHTLRAWQAGRTGYPIVDAGMRQLWALGWMHNRVRMIVGSFLVKHLLHHWLEGAKWFWDTLVDADLANNTLGWQWIAGCGADAAPYFRIFNPTIQGEKFDPDGTYVRVWVPELTNVPAKHIHSPWTADASTLRAANIELVDSLKHPSHALLPHQYPQPIVDHSFARDRALEALSRTRSSIS
ncbi:MAG TPA: deoxyribodipyrimidine photo-lyase [Phycisphaerales bacterium]|nr:deoxyribodipyrimidine photo-lyase [Phycisphaerales bacterium]